jgi:hypothetical protein
VDIVAEEERLDDAGDKVAIYHLNQTRIWNIILYHFRRRTPDGYASKGQKMGQQHGSADSKPIRKSA